MLLLHALQDGLLISFAPHRLMLLWAGVLCGLALGILPGIGGVAGIALLLPFTYNLDPAAAMALLLGLAATTTHGDPISAILLGAPGHAASAATTLDGFPMTKRGEGARALGAAYMSALMGGLFGAVLMAAVLPIVRPFVLYMGSPQLLGLAVLGLSMVASLAGGTPLRGLTIACVGIMFAMVGSDPQTGVLRWTMGSLYLMDGLPLVPVTLGIFALPELCDLLISRRSIASGDINKNNWEGLWQGAKDCFVNWWLVARCSWIGSVIGAIPGISASVIDWISYAHALKTERGAKETFGKGDVRGVIAAESATCSREGGALIPTIVFGVPGSAGMAILLGAFLMHGLVPGPDMLTKNLGITYSMVWSIAIANILGIGFVFPVLQPVRQAGDPALHADPAGGSFAHLYRRFRGQARLGRSLRLAGLWCARLGHETYEMAASAPRSRLHSGSDVGTLYVHFDPAIRRGLASEPKRHHSFRDLGFKPECAFSAEYSGARRSPKYARRFSCADL